MPDPPAQKPNSKRKTHASFFDLFVSNSEIDKLRGELQLRQERHKRSAAPSAGSDPAATSANSTPAADPNPETPKPDEPAKSAEDANKAAWTAAEDVALISLKAQNKTWKEIGDVLVGREKEELRLRFKEIGGTGSAEGGEAAKEGGAAMSGVQSSEGKDNKGKQKGEGGKKGKGKQGDMKGEGEKNEPAAGAPGLGATPGTAAAIVHPAEAVVADKTDSHIKGILKRGSDGGFQFESVKIPEGATNLNGSPIIYVDENDPLDIEELTYLYHMNCAFEEQRWIRMASKFFDQTGKRIDPEWLKEKLKNC